LHSTWSPAQCAPLIVTEAGVEAHALVERERSKVLRGRVPRAPRRLRGRRRRPARRAGPGPAAPPRARQGERGAEAGGTGPGQGAGLRSARRGAGCTFMCGPCRGRRGAAPAPGGSAGGARTGPRRRGSAPSASRRPHRRRHGAPMSVGRGWPSARCRRSEDLRGRAGSKGQGSHDGCRSRSSELTAALALLCGATFSGSQRRHAWASVCRRLRSAFLIKVAAYWPRHRLYRGFWLTSGTWFFGVVFSQNL